MIPAAQVAKFSRALPFWLSLGLVPLAVISAIYGGWTLLLLPCAGWICFRSSMRWLAKRTRTRIPKPQRIN